MKKQQLLAPVGAPVVGTLVTTVALANSPPGGGVNYCEWNPDLYEWICYPTATPTPTPTPTPTDTPRPAPTSMSVVFQKGAQVNRQLPAAAGGAGSLAYSVSPSLGNGLGFDLATRSIVGTPSAAANTTVYTYAVSDGSGGHASMELRVTVFDVSISVHEPIIGGSGYRWVGIGDLAWYVARHLPTKIDSGVTNTSGFRFRIRIPTSTGFQLDTLQNTGFRAHGDTCLWPDSSTANWSAWVVHNEEFWLVRCALGSGGVASVEIEVAESTATGTVRHNLTLSLTAPQAFHRNDNDVRYYLPPSSSLFPAVKPPHLSAHQLDPLLATDGIHAYLHAQASAVWAGGGVTLGSTNTSSTADVIVQGYGHVLGLDDTNDTTGYVGVMRSDKHEVPVGGRCKSDDPTVKCGLGTHDRDALNAIYQNHTPDH